MTDPSGMQPRVLSVLIAICQRCPSKGEGEGVTDPVELLCRARALRGLAEQTRAVSATVSSQDDKRTFASHSLVLDREAERLESEAVVLGEQQRLSADLHGLARAASGAVLRTGGSAGDTILALGSKRTYSDLERAAASHLEGKRRRP